LLIIKLLCFSVLVMFMWYLSVGLWKSLEVVFIEESM